MSSGRKAIGVRRAAALAASAALVLATASGAAETSGAPAGGSAPAAATATANAANAANAAGTGAAAGTEASAADLKRGERLFLQCRACHALGTDGEGKVGPPLGGVIGRKAAAVPGFNYSKALAGAGLTWDDATLDRWLAQPSAVVPGTSMIYAGLAKPEDRRQLLAWLKQATAAR